MPPELLDRDTLIGAITTFLVGQDARTLDEIRVALGRGIDAWSGSGLLWHWFRGRNALLGLNLIQRRWKSDPWVAFNLPCQDATRRTARLLLFLAKRIVGQDGAARCAARP